QKSQIEILGQQRSSILEDRDDTLALLKPLAEAHEELKKDAEELGRLTEDQKLEIKKLTDSREALIAEHEARVAEMTRIGRRQEESSEARVRELNLARDQVSAQLDALRLNSEKEIAAIKEERQKAIGERDAALGTMAEKAEAQDRQIQALACAHERAIFE